MAFGRHSFRMGSHSSALEELPDPGGLDAFIASSRKAIEPWLSAVFQAEHLNLLLGSGLTTAVASLAGAPATNMAIVDLGTEHDAAILRDAERASAAMKRGSPNIEDQLRSALALLAGLQVLGDRAAGDLRRAIDVRLASFLHSLLITEAGIAAAREEARSEAALAVLQSFLLSFASRTASRERLHIFTTNYDRLVEHGCDLAGIRIVDRFVGTLSPVFRTSRVEVDVHYNPPGIRGEPRFMEGVIRLSKLHGSLDWVFDQQRRRIHRTGIPFGASPTHTDVPRTPLDTLMIYPNPAKDVETTQYPYAELFRDFASAVCRPNAALVSYGYGFGDDHVNRVLLDMLTIPSTHLVAIVYEVDDRFLEFCSKTREAQVSILAGSHFGDLKTLVENYLPKPALDYITGRMTELLKRRPLDRPLESYALVHPAAIREGSA